MGNRRLGVGNAQLAVANCRGGVLEVTNSAMTTTIPSSLEDELEFDANKDVQDSHIVEVFIESDRPFLSRRHVEREIGLSSQGTRDRLSNLEEREVLNSAAAGSGRVWWIHNDDSAWPIPPDVEVEPVSSDPTVPELLDRPPVQLSGVGLILMVAGALFTTLFTLALAYDVAVPIVATEQLLLWAIGSVFAGIAFCIGGASVWMLDRIGVLSSS
jgi:hypothetical protein